MVRSFVRSVGRSFAFWLSVGFFFIVLSVVWVFVSALPIASSSHAGIVSCVCQSVQGVTRSVEDAKLDMFGVGHQDALCQSSILKSPVTNLQSRLIPPFFSSQGLPPPGLPARGEGQTGFLRASGVGRYPMF